MTRGIVFDHKEYALYDGPGVRQTAFLKGCPLRCQWCHNPEGLETAPELIVSTASCTGCGKCRCAKERCDACGACITACPLGLRRICGREMTAEELARELLKQADYYAALEGGVTFSGGEPLLQHGFLLEVMGLLDGVHIAVETSGHAPGEVFRQVLERTDYLLFDFKLADPALHKRYTGVDNRLILENLDTLCASGVPFALRMPLIPGVNDNREHFRRAAEWIAGAAGLDRVELLPYHNTAGAKYAMTGREYRPAFHTGKAVEIPTGIFDEYQIRSCVL